ncbi:MAG: hypothetical protein Q8Q12_18370 [bacterium]|nr:hypothetical protein [bacterium]
MKKSKIKKTGIGLSILLYAPAILILQLSGGGGDLRRAIQMSQ